ncbi:hypothetical protein ABBQ38_003467 [Trebouxia sp. C0009 RCD-2024]
MGSIPAQLSALARNALSWRCSSSLHTSAVLQTSTQSVCSVLLQDATAHTSSDARLSDCVHQTVVSSFHFGHSSHHEHDEPVYHTCNQVFLPRSATTPSVSCSSASTVSCLVDTSRQHRQSLQSTLWSTPSLRHLQPVLLRLHAAPSHIRHISSAVSCWRPPQSNQDTPHARGPMPRPMYQTPPLQHGRGVGNPQHVSEQSSSQAPYSERQRPPFQRSSPPHTRQPGARPPSTPQQPVGPTYRRNNIAAPVEPQVKKLKANRDITAPEVRLVGADGSHQVLPLAQALQAAREAKLDLVEVAGGANPPVCRLLNHSQVSFETKVKERRLEKLKHENRRTALIKEVQFGAHTAEHDMQVKLRKAKEFLEKGHRVKCILKTKPVRGQSQKDGLKMLPLLKERMTDFAEVSAPPATEKQAPNALSFYLAPLPQQK